MSKSKEEIKTSSYLYLSWPVWRHHHFYAIVTIFDINMTQYKNRITIMSAQIQWSCLYIVGLRTCWCLCVKSSCSTIYLTCSKTYFLSEKKQQLCIYKILCYSTAWLAVLICKSFIDFKPRSPAFSSTHLSRGNSAQMADLQKMCLDWKKSKLSVVQKRNAVTPPQPVNHPPVCKEQSAVGLVPDHDASWNAKVQYSRHQII